MRISDYSEAMDAKSYRLMVDCVYSTYAWHHSKMEVLILRMYIHISVYIALFGFNSGWLQMKLCRRFLDYVAAL